jgi:hypothetical protein
MRTISQDISAAEKVLSGKSSDGYFVPFISLKEIPSTGATAVKPCPHCRCPVVDHPDAIQAHNTRLRHRGV